MNEAERCDRISLMHAGKVLISDTPHNIVAGRKAATLEDAFISYLEEATGEVGRQSQGDCNDVDGSAPQTRAVPNSSRAFDLAENGSLYAARGAATEPRSCAPLPRSVG